MRRKYVQDLAPILPETRRYPDAGPNWADADKDFLCREVQEDSDMSRPELPYEPITVSVCLADAVNRSFLLEVLSYPMPGCQTGAP